MNNTGYAPKVGNESNRIFYVNRNPRPMRLPGIRFLFASLAATAMLVVLLALAAGEMAQGQQPAEVKEQTKASPAAATQTPAVKPSVPVPVPVPVPTPTPAPAPAPTSVDICSQCKGPYCPTIIQCKDLSIRQKDAIIAAQAYNSRLAQEALNWDEYKQKEATVQLMIDECRKVMTENKWPKEVRCTPNTSPVGFVIPSQQEQSTAPVPATAPVQGQGQGKTPPAVPAKAIGPNPVSKSDKVKPVVPR